MKIDHEYGVPTVAVHTAVFQWVVRSVARANGMPHMRQVFVPQPIMGKSPRELRVYVDGNDPITGRPVMQEVIEGLTSPLSAEDLKERPEVQGHPANGHRLQIAAAVPPIPRTLQCASFRRQRCAWRSRTHRFDHGSRENTAAPLAPGEFQLAILPSSTIARASHRSHHTGKLLS